MPDANATYFHKDKPQTDQALRYPFISFADFPKPAHEWEKKYPPPSDDVPSSSFDSYTREILRIVFNLMEMARDFEGTYKVDMSLLYSSLWRRTVIEAGIAKGLEGAGPKLATEQVGKMVQQGTISVEQAQAILGGVAPKQGGGFG